MIDMRKLDICNGAQVASILGVVFVLVGILGFIPNPIVSPNGLFAVNVAHNIVHLLAGGVLLGVGKMGHAKEGLLAVGIVYVLVAILGYMMMNDMLLGVVKVNMADHYLHLVLGLVIIFAGVKAKPPKKR